MTLSPTFLDSFLGLIDALVGYALDFFSRAVDFAALNVFMMLLHLGALPTQISIPQPHKVTSKSRAFLATVPNGDGTPFALFLIYRVPKENERWLWPTKM
jgi:hypothetical protein